MTKLLEQAMRAAGDLSPAAQDDIAMIVLRLISDEEPAPVVLTPEERHAVEESMAEEARGEFATDEEVKAVWAKYGL